MQKRISRTPVLQIENIEFTVIIIRYRVTYPAVCRFIPSRISSFFIGRLTIGSLIHHLFSTSVRRRFTVTTSPQVKSDEHKQNIDISFHNYDFKLLNRSFLVCSKGYIVFCRRCIRPEFCYLFCEIVENILRNLLYIRIIRICRYVFFFIIPVIRRHSDADSSSLFSLDTVKD